jgi:hypothetical protein
MRIWWLMEVLLIVALVPITFALAIVLGAALLVVGVLQGVLWLCAEIARVSAAARKERRPFHLEDE